jgi:hypothetical protein
MASYFQSISLGIEVDESLFLCSLRNLTKVASACFNDGTPIPPVAFVSADIMDIKTFDGIDLIYSFDCLFPPILLNHMAVLFNRSTTAKTLVSFNNLKRLEDAGYEYLKLRSKIPVRMRGSAEGKTCYIYMKQKQEQGCLSLRSESGASTDIDAVDPLFRHQFELYRSGNLDERNLSIDIKSYCLPRELRGGERRGSV